MKEVEKSAEPFRFAKDACTAICWLVGAGDDIIKSLMVAFALMVGQILIERVAQSTFAKENQLIETLVLH